MKNNKLEKQAIQEKVNPSQEERQTHIPVRPLSRLWEFYVVHRNVLEDLGRVLEQLIDQHYRTGKPLPSPGLINVSFSPDELHKTMQSEIVGYLAEDYTGGMRKTACYWSFGIPKYLQMLGKGLLE